MRIFIRPMRENWVKTTVFARWKTHKPLPFWSTSTHQQLVPLELPNRWYPRCSHPWQLCRGWLVGDWTSRATNAIIGSLIGSASPWRWTARTWSHDGLGGRWLSEIPGGVFSGEAAGNLPGCTWIYLDEYIFSMCYAVGTFYLLLGGLFQFGWFSGE